jgi:hypothetical protein
MLLRIGILSNTGRIGRRSGQGKGIFVPLGVVGPVVVKAEKELSIS